MTAPRYGAGEGYHCRCEGESSQRHLDESRAGKESSRLNERVREKQSRGRAKEDKVRKTKQRMGEEAKRAWPRGVFVCMLVCVPHVCLLAPEANKGCQIL